MTRCPNTYGLPCSSVPLRACGYLKLSALRIEDVDFTRGVVFPKVQWSQGQSGRHR